MYRLIQRFITDDSMLPKAILLSLCVALLVTGIYAVGPWYVGGPTTAMGVTLESDLIRAIPATYYIAAGGAGVYGLIRSNPVWRYRGAFLCTLAYVFMTLLRLLTFGFTPIIWLFLLALGFISAIIFLWEAGRETE